MTEMIGNILQNIFGDNAVLATIVIALIPLIELKGAIPFGTSTDFWGENAINVWQSFVCSIVGGIIITVILAFIFKPIYNYIKDKKFFKNIVEFFTDSLNKKSEEINSEQNDEKNEKKNLIKKILITIGFVAIPVPGTGVYTGTALAILLGLKPLTAIVCVTIGNIIAGIIITTICAIFPAITTILFFVFIVFIVVLLVYKIIVHQIKKKKNI